MGTTLLFTLVRIHTLNDTAFTSMPSVVHVIQKTYLEWPELPLSGQTEAENVGSIPWHILH